MKTYLFVAERGASVQQLITAMDERGIDTQLFVGDDPDSVQIRANYDITTHPAALVTLDDGTYVYMWQGALPTVAELQYMVQGR